MLSAQYESFVLPFPIILSLPAGIFGAFFFLKMLNLENNIVIGTYPKMGVGLDTKCFNALYLLDNKKNIIQAEGRCRNDDLIIFDLIDSDGIFKNHYYLHKKFYRERKDRMRKDN